MIFVSHNGDVSPQSCDCILCYLDFTEHIELLQLLPKIPRSLNKVLLARGNM